MGASYRHSHTSSSFPYEWACQCGWSKGTFEESTLLFSKCNHASKQIFWQTAKVLQRLYANGARSWIQLGAEACGRRADTWNGERLLYCVLPEHRNLGPDGITVVPKSSNLALIVGALKTTSGLPWRKSSVRPHTNSEERHFTKLLVFSIGLWVKRC